MSDSDFLPDSDSRRRFAACRQLMLRLHNEQKRMEVAAADSATNPKKNVAASEMFSILNSNSYNLVIDLCHVC